MHYDKCYACGNAIKNGERCDMTIISWFHGNKSSVSFDLCEACKTKLETTLNREIGEEIDFGNSAE